MQAPVAEEDLHFDSAEQGRHLDDQEDDGASAALKRVCLRYAKENKLFRAYLSHSVWGVDPNLPKLKLLHTHQ